MPIDTQLNLDSLWGRLVLMHKSKQSCLGSWEQFTWKENYCKLQSKSRFLQTFRDLLFRLLRLFKMSMNWLCRPQFLSDWYAAFYILVSL